LRKNAQSFARTDPIDKCRNGGDCALGSSIQIHTNPLIFVDILYWPERPIPKRIPKQNCEKSPKEFPNTIVKKSLTEFPNRIMKNPQKNSRKGL
jgi:hypothetical protein